jgi:NAD(P)-dependent dehydrogenase (short-subunit alcohol dehydrogenase family)
MAASTPRRVLITGAAQGIGFRAAELLCERGARVALLDRDGDRVREAAARLGDHALGLAADVTDAAATTEAMGDAADRFGGLDLVVANAGVPTRGARTVQDWPEDELQRVMAVNAIGVWNTARAGLSHLQDGGRLALVASVAVYSCGAFLAPYTMSKAAVEALGRALRVELAPRGIGVTIAYFAPVQTAFASTYDRDPVGKALNDALPKWAASRLTADDAARGLLRGIHRGKSRVMVPPMWHAVDALRGPAAVFGDPLLARSRVIKQLAGRGR